MIERSLYEDIFKQKENSSPHLPNSLENAESDDNVFDELLVSRDEIDSEHIQQTEPNDDLDEKYDHAILNQRPTLEDIRERRMDKLGRRRTLRAVPENAPEENFARQSERQKPTNDSGKMNLSANRRNQWGDLIEEEEFE